MCGLGHVVDVDWDVGAGPRIAYPNAAAAASVHHCPFSLCSVWFKTTDDDEATDAVSFGDEGEGGQFTLTCVCVGVRHVLVCCSALLKYDFGRPINSLRRVSKSEPPTALARRFYGAQDKSGLDRD